MSRAYQAASVCRARSLHWSDLHQMLLRALPEGVVRFGTTVTSVEQAEGGGRVRIEAERKAQQGPAGGAERISAEADLVIAADGSMSDTRQKLVPAVHRRQARSCPGCCCAHTLFRILGIALGFCSVPPSGRVPVARLGPGCVREACAVAP